jgi:hypothetical protein
MAEKPIYSDTNHVTNYSHDPWFPVIDDPTGTPVDGHMTVTDIKTIADTEAAAAIAALGTLGDVVGPAGAINNHLAVFDGVTGKLIKDGGAIPAGGTGTVTTTGAVTAGHYVKFIDVSHIEDGGTIAGNRTITNVSAAYVALASDDLIICNKATSMTVTLLAATGSGRKVSVASIGVGVITIEVASAGTINNAATMVLNQWDTADLVDISAGMYLFVKYG